MYNVSKYWFTGSDMQSECAKILWTFGDKTLRFLNGFLAGVGMLHNFNMDPLISTELPILIKFN